jgi:hypothetical protein
MRLADLQQATTATSRCDQHTQAENEEPQVIGLRTPTERRVGKPMLIP